MFIVKPKTYFACSVPSPKHICMVPKTYFAYLGQGVEKVVRIGSAIGGPKVVRRIEGQIESNDFTLGVGPHVGEREQGWILRPRIIEVDDVDGVVVPRLFDIGVSVLVENQASIEWGAPVSGRSRDQGFHCSL